MQRSGRDTRCGTNGYYAASPNQSLHGGFVGIIEIPWEFQQKEPDKKKIAGSGLFRREKPGKTQFPDVQKRLKVRVSGRKTVANGAKDCVGSGKSFWQRGHPVFSWRIATGEDEREPIQPHRSRSAWKTGSPAARTICWTRFDEHRKNQGYEARNR
jgi:hypothetical protein